MTQLYCIATWSAAGKDHNCILPEGHAKKCECDCGAVMETRLNTSNADYLLGRCIPLLQILDDNEVAIEVLSLIREYVRSPAPPEEKDAELASLRETISGLEAEWADSDKRLEDSYRDYLELKAELTKAEATISGLQGENQELRQVVKDRDQEARRLMWITHGHMGIYGDDGEMQCGQCAPYGCWDYKNSPWSEVVTAYNAAILERARPYLPPNPLPQTNPPRERTDER